MLSQPSSGSCSPPPPANSSDLCDLLSFPSSCALWKARSRPRCSCCASTSPYLHCPHQQSPAQGHGGHLRCALVHKADATGTWFAAEEIIVSSSPSLNPSCLWLLLQSRIPWPELRTQRSDYWGLAIRLWLYKRKIYHYWFDQTFLELEIESKEQAKLLLNAQYGFQARTCQVFSGLFFFFLVLFQLHFLSERHCYLDL